MLSNLLQFTFHSPVLILVAIHIGVLTFDLRWLPWNPDSPFLSRHESYKTQYRAMFVMNCSVNREEVLRYKNPGNRKKKRGAKKMRSNPEDPVETDVEEVYHPVMCTECSTEVAVYDKDEVFHFFNVLASHSWGATGNWLHSPVWSTYGLFPLSYHNTQWHWLLKQYFIVMKEWSSTFISSPFFLFNFPMSNDGLIISTFGASLETLGLFIY